VVPSTNKDGGTGLTSNVMLFFAALGVVYHIIELYTFITNTKQEVAAAAQNSVNLKGGHAIKKSGANLATALLHVGTDTMRSTATSTKALLLMVMLVSLETQSLIDASCIYFIVIVIYTGLMYRTQSKDWLALVVLIHMAFPAQ
jgi:hypothetical protein